MKTAEIEIGKPYYLGNTTTNVVVVVGVRCPWVDLGRQRKDGIRVCATHPIANWRKKGDEWVVPPRDIFRLAPAVTT